MEFQTKNDLEIIKYDQMKEKDVNTDARTKEIP